jgi:hypothetical protein
MNAINSGELKYPVYEPSNTDQSFINRLVKLLWINEIEYAQDLINREYHNRLSLEEFLFNIVICTHGIEQIGRFYSHPEYKGVHYGLLYESEAQKISTTTLADLLQMSEPKFTS